MAEIERTLIADYMLGGQRYSRGTRIPLTQTQLDAAVKAAVVHADDKLDAEVPVNDPQGNVADEQTGSGPPPDAREQPRGRKQAGDRFTRSSRR